MIPWHQPGINSHQHLLLTLHLYLHAQLSLRLLEPFASCEYLHMDVPQLPQRETESISRSVVSDSLKPHGL